MKEALFYSLIGFLSGSVLYSWLLPKQLCGVDIVAASDDGNPGTHNAMQLAGKRVGSLCLLCDLAKGFLPVWIAAQRMDAMSLWFAPVLAAPVLGHVFSPMLHGRGGKGIAASFGALLGLLPWNLSLLALAAPYVLLSTVVRIRPHAKRSVVSYLVFAATALVVNPPSIALGCLLIAAPVVARHWPELRSA
ncbi:MAG: glycerol-3-phosphate acyltransferase [Oscillospiraceae bacterium]|nr:glycerol-3-phosphate acyltransferase [Oscillospiraceae bacterium]